MMLDPAKQLEALRSTPWWVAITIAAAAAVFLFVPTLAPILALSPFFSAAAWLALVVFGLLFFFQMANLLVSAMTKVRSAKGEPLLTSAHVAKEKRFHITPVSSQCWWGEATQPDGNIGLQLYIVTMIKNLTDKPLNLLKVRIVEPNIDGTIIQDMILSSESGIGPGRTSRVPLHLLMIRKNSYPAGHFHAVIAVQDDEGNEETVAVTLRDQRSPIV